MPKQISTKHIFLSHAAADLKLVESFETLLCKALNVTSANIFCSSLEGQGVAKGGSFVEGIKQEAIDAKAVVALISPAYMESPFCLAELGAAWVLNSHRFPIVVPPNTFEVMQATLLGVVGVKIDNEDALSQLLEDIGQALALPVPTAGVKARALREFFQKWPRLKDKIGKAKRVDAAVHKKALDDLKSSREAWDSCEQELETAKSQIEALKKLKDAAQVAQVSKAFGDSDWEMEFDSVLANVAGLSSEVGGSRVLRHMILDFLGKPSWPDLNDDYIGRAIEIGLFDTDSKSWNHSSEEMRTLSKAMEDVDVFLADHPEAIAEFKRLKKRHETDDIRFWEQHLSL